MKKITRMIGKLIVLVGIGLAVYCLLEISTSAGHTDFSKYQTQEICVEQGQGLYSIGKKYCGEDININDWEQAVMELNGMQGSNLYAGQYIMIYTEMRE